MAGTFTLKGSDERHGRDERAMVFKVLQPERRLEEVVSWQVLAKLR